MIGEEDILNSVDNKNEELLSGFNEQQREAVEFCDGPSLVIAGAGSGKTRVLTYKIAYLMRMGYEPWSILALTFTNKAANEMKERIAKIVGEENARRLWMGTFHSVFLRILRIEHERVGYSANFSIYDASDSKSLVKGIIKEMGLDEKIYKPSNVLSRISNAKNQLVSAEEYASNAANYQADLRAKMPMLRDVYIRYRDRCRQADAMDFDDILVYTYELFDKNPDVLEKYVERFRYVLVDEYQDTNFAQHSIVWQLTKERKRVCVVGDDAQSIYSFRGAKIDNILKFCDIYEGCHLFKLERNYRSTRTIVEAANSLISKNNWRIPKDVFSENEQGELIPVTEAYSDVEEGQIVVKKILELRRKENAEYSDFAILYRTNAQSRVFEETLRKQGLPYRIFGGLSFYQRKEIKDVIAYFRLSVNPHDEEAFKRVINYPARGIGNTTLNKIIDAATSHEVSLWTVISEPLTYGLNVSKGTAEKIREFHDLVASFIELTETSDAENAGMEIIKRSGISADVYADRTPENLSRQENVEELVNGLSDFCASRIEEGNNNIHINDYLSEVSLLSDVDTDKGDDERKVTLMTIHSAKGLEFKTVFIVGLEENLFPSQMAGDSVREMEEERRLFYVALTRAEHHCFLSYAKSRFRYGKMEFGNPSRFLNDIDQKYLLRTTGSRISEKRSRGYGEVDLPWKRKTRTLFDEEFKNEKDEATAPYPSDRDYSAPQRNSYYSGAKRETSAYSAASKPQSVAPPYSGLRKLTPIEQFSAVVQGTSGMGAKAESTSQSTCSDLIKIGTQIEHERFGIGVIEKIDGKGDNCKATVVFKNVGKKQLLLKFAKFKIKN